jgi:transcriptional regulator with XRE-family HTH domain
MARFKNEEVSRLVLSEQRKTGLTQTEILARIGISPVSFWKYTANGKVPDIHTLSKLALYFSVSRDTFFDDDNNTPSGGLLANEEGQDALYVSARRGRKPAVMAGEGQMALLAQQVAELREQLSEVVRHMTVKIRVYMFGGLGWCPGSCTPSWAS